MASIGELTATVRADVSGFVGPMQQVVTTTQRTASAVQSITAPTRTLSSMLGQTATSGRMAGASLGSLRGTLASLASGLVGIPGPLGNLASKLALFGVGGGLTVTVLAGLTAIAAAFKLGREEAEEQAQTVDDLAKSYDELSGRAVRARLDMARAALAAANANTSLGVTRGMTQGGIPFPTIGRVRDMDAVAAASRALLQAQKDLADFEANRLRPAQEAATRAARERLQALAELVAAIKDAIKIDTEANTAKKVTALTKEAQAWRQVKTEIIATMEAERRRALEIPEDLQKAKSDDTKTRLMGEGGQAIQGARDAANAISQAFMAAFTDNEKNIIERVTSVLRNALMEAVQRVLAQKIFEGIVSGFTGGKGGGVVDIAGDVVGQIFGAPPSMASGGGTIIVPLSSLPPALSPVEVARDVQHQTLWMETARVAESNGFRLRVR